MHDWNAVATLHAGAYAEGCRLLGRHGRVDPTDYYNVVALAVADVAAFSEGLRGEWEVMPELRETVSRVVPAMARFEFQSPEAFEESARAAAAGFLPRLHGAAFHVRMHRRGFKGRLSSQHEERFLDQYLLTELEAAGAPGRIVFDDPDAIVALETVGQWAGLSCWTRADLARYPYLRLD